MIRNNLIYHTVRCPGEQEFSALWLGFLVSSAQASVAPSSWIFPLRSNNGQSASVGLCCYCSRLGGIRVSIAALQEWLRHSSGRFEWSADPTLLVSSSLLWVGPLSARRRPHARAYRLGSYLCPGNVAQPAVLGWLWQLCKFWLLSP